VRAFLSAAAASATPSSSGDGDVVFFDGSSCFVAPTPTPTTLTTLTNVGALAALHDVALAELTACIDAVRLGVYKRSAHYPFPGVDDCGGMAAWVALCYLQCSELNQRAAALLSMLPAFDSTVRALTGRYGDVCFGTSVTCSSEDAAVATLCQFLLASLTKTVADSNAGSNLLLRTLLRISLAVRRTSSSGGGGGVGEADLLAARNDVLDAVLSVFEQVPRSAGELPIPFLHIAGGGGQPGGPETGGDDGGGRQCALLRDAMELQSVLSLFDALLGQRTVPTTPGGGGYNGSSSSGHGGHSGGGALIGRLRVGLEALAVRCARALPLTALAVRSALLVGPHLAPIYALY
jgi:hypothetical protein